MLSVTLAFGYDVIRIVGIQSLQNGRMPGTDFRNGQPFKHPVISFPQAAICLHRVTRMRCNDCGRLPGTPQVAADQGVDFDFCQAASQRYNLSPSGFRKGAVAMSLVALLLIVNSFTVAYGQQC